jgi:hypothetical protein
VVEEVNVEPWAAAAAARTYLDEMLAHVVAEVFHERDFLGECSGEDAHGVIGLAAIALDVLHVVSIGQQQQTCGIIEEHAHTVTAAASHHDLPLPRTVLASNAHASQTSCPRNTNYLLNA